MLVADSFTLAYGLLDAVMFRNNAAMLAGEAAATSVLPAVDSRHAIYWMMPFRAVMKLWRGLSLMKVSWSC